MNGIFDHTIKLLHDTLDLRAARHKLLQSNIANQETPGYRAVDIDFEKEIKKADAASGTGGIMRTNAGHLPIIPERGMAPKVVKRQDEAVGYDGNSVGIETEMVKLSENSLMYNIATKMLRSKFNMIMMAIKEGGR
jgi:flagellar basal-body rod protein FlgB